MLERVKVSIRGKDRDGRVLDVELKSKTPVRYGRAYNLKTVTHATNTPSMVRWITTIIYLESINDWSVYRVVLLQN